MKDVWSQSCVSQKWGLSHFNALGKKKAPQNYRGIESPILFLKYDLHIYKHKREVVTDHLSIPYYIEPTRLKVLINIILTRYPSFYESQLLTTKFVFCYVMIVIKKKKKK